MKATGVPASLPTRRAAVWVCLASGPSQHPDDIAAVGVHSARGSWGVLAINNQIAHAPWADVLYSCDGKWWEEYSDADRHPEIAAAIAKVPERFTRDAFAVRYGAKPVPWEAGDGLGRSAVRSGCNSGYQAMNLTYLCGARLIVLLGYDMQHTGGRHHNHADHPRPLGNFAQGMPALCLGKFPALARDLAREGVRVINATRDTALTCFERMPLADALRVAAAYAAPNGLPAVPPAPRGFS